MVNRGEFVQSVFRERQAVNGHNTFNPTDTHTYAYNWRV